MREDHDFGEWAEEQIKWRDSRIAELERTISRNAANHERDNKAFSAQLTEAYATIERLRIRCESFDAQLDQLGETLHKLAAAQATISRKHDALETLATHLPESCHIDECCRVADLVEQALALPNDRTALDAMLKPYRDALAELVALKDMKDSYDERKQTIEMFADAAVLEGIANEYQRRKPAAWAAARVVLQADAIRQAAERN